MVVQVDSNPSPKDGAIQLIHYERVSTYGVYEDCRDEGISPKLCVCSPSSNRSSTNEQLHQQPMIVFGIQTTQLTLGEHVFLYERRTQYGIILEAFCDQFNRAYEIAIHIVSKVNVATSQGLPAVTNIKCGRIYFLIAFYQIIESQKWSLEYNVQFRQSL